ncbi:MAG: hypothetical protein HN964_04280 [Candidatus Jacksonbacteria bacterium]|jgi:hypothetical protein|nr:hypothetical protein [Candidatus Jacksonbacteria bacterium]MBT7008641.1 hypothetical protein [Candidatus Jacksonbacteria bacterium]
MALEYAIVRIDRSGNVWRACISGDKGQKRHTSAEALTQGLVSFLGEDLSPDLQATLLQKLTTDSRFFTGSEGDSLLPLKMVIHASWETHTVSAAMYIHLYATGESDGTQELALALMHHLRVPEDDGDLREALIAAAKNAEQLAGQKLGIIEPPDGGVVNTLILSPDTQVVRSRHTKQRVKG